MINFTVTEKEINEYRQAQPFPHIVIDDFLPPSLLVELVLLVIEYDGDN